MLILDQDLRNHGQSFHAPEHNYSVMAEDIQEFIDQQKLDKCVLIGHSMYVTAPRVGTFPLSNGPSVDCQSACDVLPLTQTKGCQGSYGGSSAVTRTCLSSHSR